MIPTLGCFLRRLSVVDDQGDLVVVVGSPLAQGGELLRQASPEFGQFIFHVRWNRLEVIAADHTVVRQFFEMLDEHLLADVGHEPAQLSRALRPVDQMIEDERFPFSAKDCEHRFEAATEPFFGHALSPDDHLQKCGYWNIFRHLPSSKRR